MAEFNVSGNWDANQSNGFVVNFDIQQTDTVLRGVATHSGGSVSGTVEGSVHNNQFLVSIRWSNGAIGEYNGAFNSIGRITGTTFDVNHPETRLLGLVLRHLDGSNTVKKKSSTQYLWSNNMAALFWNSDVRILSEATANIGELKRVIENELRQSGFLDVRQNNLEVAGGRNSVWLSIAHFQIEGRRFWEVVMASGDSFDVTQATVGEVVNKLRELRFL